MDNNIENSISTKELYKAYDWYQKTFPNIVQQSYDEFFNPNFKLELLGISKNINCLFNNESCFVTKVKIAKDYDMFFRMTDKTLDIILNKTLGQSKNKFQINKISELEAKIITTFNDYLFEHLKNVLIPTPKNELKRNNFDVIHLTFIIKEAEEYNKKTGKVIISLPEVLLNPDLITSSGDKFSEVNFPKTETFAKVIIGKTKFTLYDLKHLDVDDVVVFENSNLENLQLYINGKTFPVNINPNMDILLPADEDGGDNMSSETHNIWDNIEVEMNAEFDAIKVSLGELKNIENGLVVDLTSIYDNNVTLKVEGNPIATGTLVIVNDRYGVKINNVIAQTQNNEGAMNTEASQNNEDYQSEMNGGEEYNENEYSDNENEYSDNQNDEMSENNGDEEFDYSDFELEDENI